jgi:hypothetical protein
MTTVLTETTNVNADGTTSLLTESGTGVDKTDRLKGALGSSLSTANANASSADSSSGAWLDTARSR